MKKVSRYIGFFILFLLTQGLVFNQVSFGFLNSYINIFPYVLVILFLPVNIPKWLLLLLGFTAGWVIDLFTNTPGMHASATTFLAFIRPTILKYIAPRDGYKPDAEPSIQELGLPWFSYYSLLLIFVHHLWLFTIETFRLSEIYMLLAKSLLSTLFSFGFVILLDFLIFRRKS